MKPCPVSAIDNQVRRRILVRAPNWIGDAVMSMPAIQRLRKLDPHAYLALLTPAKLRDLWLHNPYLNNVITFDEAPDIGTLRRQRFDLALVFPNSFRSAWEIWRAGIPRRVGFAGEHRRWLLTDVVQEVQAEQPVTRLITVAGQTFPIKQFSVLRHQTQRYLDLICHLGANPEPVLPRIWLAPGELPSLRKFLPSTTAPFIGIHAGAEFGPAKRWPATRFAEVARRLNDELPCRWVIFGGPSEVDIAREIETTLRPHLSDPADLVNLAGQTGLRDLCELIQHCRLLITNDTGPMHLAYALGTPVVAIFTSTSPELTGPLGPRCAVIHAKVECTPCFRRDCPIGYRCMDTIAVEQVVAAARELFERASAR